MRTTTILSAIALGTLVLANPVDKRAVKMKWMGVDESGAEFGQNNLPGTYNKDYTFPATSSIDVSRPK